jgi:hypothetical protein
MRMRTEGAAVGKPPPVEILDDFFRGDPAARREAYRYALDVLARYEEAPLSETTAELAGRDAPGLDFNSGDVDHFRDHWLDDPNVDGVMRRGYAEAIRVALEHDPPLGLDTVWVMGSADEYELHIVEGRDVVTVIAFIPRGRADEGARAAAASSRSRSWVVRAEGGGGRVSRGSPSVVVTQFSGPGAPAA